MANEVGKWAMIIGIAVALIMAVLNLVNVSAGNLGTYVPLVLVVLGLVTGFVNMNTKEIRGLLIAVIALVVVGFADLNVIPVIGGALQVLVQGLVVLIAPAGLIVALTEAYNILVR